MEKPTFVILGVTGDLTKRKLLPAIYNLIKKNKIENFGIVGAARSDTSMKKIISESKKFLPASSKQVWKKIEKHSIYVRLDFINPADYEKMNKSCLELEKKLGLSGKRIFHLATLPDNFPSIIKNIGKSYLCQKKKDWPKLVFEKPFGKDLKSAQKINKIILTVFNEKQIFRIDHYLGKELVTNINLIRFTNRMLEPLWCKKHIENVQIILNEELTVKDRGSFYDRYGVLRDMVQNHMLQLTSLIAMESPKKLEGENIKDKKVEIFKKIKVKDILLGQYKGFLNEKGVNKKSVTPTFATLKLEINTPRWEGVPFFLKTGKALDKTSAVIYLKFKEVSCLLSKTCPADTNYFIINLKTNKGMAMELNTKIPEQLAVKPVKLEFREKNAFGPNTPEAYEILLRDVILGDQSSFVRKDAIEYTWKIIDSIKKSKIYQYKIGSNGPSQLIHWNKKNKIKWKK